MASKLYVLLYEMYAILKNNDQLKGEEFLLRGGRVMWSCDYGTSRGHSIVMYSA